METEQKMELVEVLYWTCPNPNHRHRDKHVAEACCKKPGTKTNKRWTPEALAELFEFILSGTGGWKEIAAHANVCIPRATDVVALTQRRLLHPDLLIGVEVPSSGDSVGRLAGMRANPEFWRGQLAKFRSS